MHQFFICNQDEIESKIKTLTHTGRSDDGSTEYYQEQNNNEEWLLTRYQSESHGGGVAVLKRLPVPTTEALIDIALTSGDKNDIIGASRELSETETYGKEDFRNKLLTRLLQVDTSNLTVFEKERVKLIIYESELYDPTNRRNIIGKHITEIQSDANYYSAISQKAKNILADMEKYNS